MSRDKLEGNLLGLSKAQRDQIERLLRRRVPQNEVTTQEFNRELAALSFETGRQIGALLDRKGQVELVVVGQAKSIELPKLKAGRTDPSRLRGLRFIHTHLSGDPLGDDDINDLQLQRFDLILAVTVDEEGFPGPSHLAHLLPANPEGKHVEVFPPILPGQFEINFPELIGSLEEEFARTRPRLTGREREGAILIGIVEDHSKNGSGNGHAPRIDAMAELKELTRSAGLDALATITQKRRSLNPRTVLGTGKLREVAVKALQLGASILIFDRELSPSQVNALQDATELKIIDRSQLILDIFAQRAQSREGKIQVELALLRYTQPRLTGHGVDMSRLMGGIGGRGGPGETKLEIDRRRIRERIHRLEKDLDGIRRTRSQKRERRRSRDVPVVSIVGYTNAGKSTLLNQLTESEVTVEDKMFATLDPVSRRLRFPREREIVITDTVGFIRDLPKGLMSAFMATLEELEDADLFLQVVDASDPSWEGQIAAVEKILEEMEMKDTPRLIVLNKTDLISPEEAGHRAACIPGSVSISAVDRNTLKPLLETLERLLFAETSSGGEAWMALGY